MEQLKAKQDQIANDNTKAIEQLKTKQRRHGAPAWQAFRAKRVAQDVSAFGRTVAASQNTDTGAAAAPSVPTAVAVLAAVAVL